jgi:hypothetical protein
MELCRAGRCATVPVILQQVFCLDFLFLLLGDLLHGLALELEEEVLVDGWQARLQLDPLGTLPVQLCLDEVSLQGVHPAGRLGCINRGGTFQFY